MKRQFDKVKRLSQKRQEASWQLDRLIDARWGFSYSDTDDDQIIDTLDYATDDISFEDFCRKMDEYKKNLEDTESFGCVI